jgi:Uma2 family endonuclease
MIATGLLRDCRVELLNGVVVDRAPEGPEHAYLADTTSKYLARSLGDRAIVREGHPITLKGVNDGDDSEPEPDVAVVKPLGSSYRQRHPYGEDVLWLMEYADSSVRKDQQTKRSLYAVAGIPEYWLVNLKTRQVIVLREPVDGDYTLEQRYGEGDIAPLAFPTLSVSVKRLLEG